MNELGEGDIDIIKAPIVIDNVSVIFLGFNSISIGIWTNESRNWWRTGTISCL